MKFSKSLSLIIFILFFLIGSCSINGNLDSISRVMIPNGASIDSAYLNVYILATYSKDTPILSIHKITSNWDEYTATWENSSNIYDPEPIGSVQINGIGWHQIDIKPYIEDCIIDPSSTNHGIMLIYSNPVLVNEENFGNAGFASSENSDIEKHPYLEMTYNINGNLLTDDKEFIENDVMIWAKNPTINYAEKDCVISGYGMGYESSSLIKFDIDEEEIVGTGTPGYWKNHPEAWPVDEIQIGNFIYSKEVAIETMSIPVKRDKWYTMFRTLVAAKLNVLNGANNVVSSTIESADSWMAINNHMIDGKLVIIKANSDEWKEGQIYHTILDDYNNGILDGAPSRDTLE